MEDYVRADGTSLIYIQVIIRRKPLKIQVDLRWPREKFDSLKYCKKRYKDDPDSNDYNIIIRDTVGRINEIFKYYRLTNTILTKESFEKEYYNPLSKTNFISYYESKMIQRYKDQDITNPTFKNHKNTLNKLKLFKSQILFSEFDTNFPTAFTKHLEKKCNIKNINTKWGHHKDIKAYLKLAKKDKIFFADPYEDFQNKNVEGTWKNIEREDILKLYNYYKKTLPGSDKRKILQAFLGAGVFTGLRISDWYKIKREQVFNDQLVIIPFKTRRKGKMLILPLTKYAIDIFNDSMNENNVETIFFPFSEKHVRETMKKLRGELEIKSKLNPHAGRESFGTEFINMGGDVTTLQKYFDHYKIQTTMKYVHRTKKNIAEDVSKMNSLLD
jgi:site-specific recombinase XerD